MGASGQPGSGHFSPTDASRQNHQSLGLIAGSRALPLMIAREARLSGIGRIVAVAFEGETDPAIEKLADEVVWLRVGQLGKMIKAFTDRQVSRCVMAGQIAPKNLFDLRPDLRAMLLLMRVKERNAHSLFGAIASEMEKEGVQLIEATPWLRQSMPNHGFRLGKALSAEQKTDAAFGFHIAKETSRLEIGQTLVVKNGTVLAVEAFEGTDECLRRGGKLAGPKGGALAVKVSKPGHDMRFDIPCFGSSTIETCVESGISALVVEAGKTILLEREKIEAVIKKHSFTIAAWPD